VALAMALDEVSAFFFPMALGVFLVPLEALAR
jgi:hypothetical protein